MLSSNALPNNIHKQEIKTDAKLIFIKTYILSLYKLQQIKNIELDKKILKRNTEQKFVPTEHFKGRGLPGRCS